MATADEIKGRIPLVKIQTEWSTWDLIVGVSPQPNGKMLGIEGEFDAWPKYVQDKIMAALVRDCQPAVGNSVKIVASGCYQDVPWEPAYLRVVVMEFPPAPPH